MPDTTSSPPTVESVFFRCSSLHGVYTERHTYNSYKGRHSRGDIVCLPRARGLVCLSAPFLCFNERSPSAVCCWRRQQVAPAATAPRRSLRPRRRPLSSQHSRLRPITWLPARLAHLWAPAISETADRAAPKPRRDYWIEFLDRSSPPATTPMRLDGWRIS